MDIEQFLSKERLNAYKLQDEDESHIILKRYLWNLELCSAFYVPLHAFEIGFRNYLYLAIAEHYGEDWLTKENMLTQYEENSVIEAVKQLKKRNELTLPGKIIAELTLGFWASLLHRKYINSLPTTPSHALFWPMCIKKAFPYIEKSNRNLRYISVRVEDLRKFRNRIFHHEPIWKMNLKRINMELKEAISWFYKDYNDTFCIDRVDEIMNKNIFRQ